MEKKKAEITMRKPLFSVTKQILNFIIAKKGKMTWPIKTWKREVEKEGNKKKLAHDRTKRMALVENFD